jgi:protoporphyrinogen/coproporphyrinogen III oxidase
VGRQVAVIGGGISGLAAAYHLRADGVRVTVLEKAPAVGGLLRVSDVAGLPLDEGAESLLNRRPEAVALARDVGLGADIVHPADVPAGVWSRGRLRPLPDGTVMGVPGDPQALSGLLDPDEVDLVAAERDRPELRLTGDVAIGELVSERMGRPVAERLVEPLLGGVYAGHAAELSLAATVPALFAAVRRERSLLDGVAAVRRATPSASVPVFAGIRGGVGRLAPAVAAASGADIRTGVIARGLRKNPDPRGPRWRIETGLASSPAFIDADAVVVAVPASASARMLADAAPAAAAELAAVDQASVAIVTMALPRSAFPELPASSGFLVPPVEGRTIKAVTFSSMKWPWLGELAGDLVVLRASVGRHRQTGDLQWPDGELVDAVLADLGAALGVRGEPVDVRVTRWEGALPQYAVGHVGRVERIRAAIGEVAGLAVCGAVYEGVGVAACVATARDAATSVLAGLAAMPPSMA